MGILRILLALSVLIGHAGKALPITQSTFVVGFVAVQCFFVISGFYMAFILNGKYHLMENFYWNRALRIFPTYWFVLLLGLVLPLLYGRINFLEKILQTDWTISSKIFMLFSNLFLFGSDVMMFFFPGLDGINFTTNFRNESAFFYFYHEIPQAWSIPLELYFYAMAPFIIKSPKKLLFCIMLSMGCRIIIGKFIGLHDPWNYRFFPMN